MQNDQNLICLLNKSTFFNVTKKIWSKKKKRGQKSLSGMVKYISVDQKELFIDIF